MIIYVTLAGGTLWVIIYVTLSRWHFVGDHMCHLKAGGTLWVIIYVTLSRWHFMGGQVCHLIKLVALCVLCCC